MAQLRPTFSESWYRVVNLRARLRASTQISRQHYRGERWYVVRDPAGNQFHRLSAPAYRFVGLLDGTRTVGQAWDLVGGQLADDAPTQPEVIQILSQLHAANLLDADITADAGVLLRRHKKMKTKELQGRLMNFLFPRIPLWDPDTFLCHWMPAMKYVLSKLGALIWLIVVGTAIFKLVPMWPQLRDAASDSIDPKNWPFLWATFVIIKLIHELGHAFSCRRFGGEVHELGVMFLVFIPAPYVDASTAWSLPNKWQRIFVGAGGMIFELFVAAVMGFIWANTVGGSYPIVHQLAYNTMLIASVSTIIFNANPLLRYDGYYILSDWLEIPNLRQKAVEYSMGLIKRHIFRIKSPIPLPPFGQRIWLFCYAIASSIYRVLVGVMIIFIVQEKVPVLGVLMAIGGVVTWVFVPIGKMVHYLLLDPELHRKRLWSSAFVASLAAVAIVVVGFIPFTVHYQAQAVVLPAQRRPIHPDSPGFVQEVRVIDGQHVAKGQVLLHLTEPSVVAELDKLRAERDALTLHAMESLISDPAQRLIDLTQIHDYYDKEIADRQRRINDLDVRSPIDGELVAPDIVSLKGRFLHVGEDIGMSVTDAHQLQVVGFIEQADAALPRGGPGGKAPTSAELRLAGDVAKVLTAQVSLWASGAIDVLPPELRGLSQASGGWIKLDPNDPKHMAMLTPQYPVFLTLANTADNIFPFQRADVRFSMGSKPLIWQWWRWGMQMVQTQSVQNSRGNGPAGF